MPVETAETRPAAPMNLSRVIAPRQLRAAWRCETIDERPYPRPTSPRPENVVRPSTVKEVVMSAEAE